MTTRIDRFYVDIVDLSSSDLRGGLRHLGRKSSEWWGLAVEELSRTTFSSKFANIVATRATLQPKGKAFEEENNAFAAITLSNFAFLCSMSHLIEATLSRIPWKEIYLWAIDQANLPRKSVTNLLVSHTFLRRHSLISLCCYLAITRKSWSIVRLLFDFPAHINQATV